MDSPQWKTYPRFGISSEGAIFPHVPVPKDYSKLLPRFYENKGKERVEELAKGVRKRTNLDLLLRWEDTKGLTNISTSTHGGFDFDAADCEFVPHNLDGTQSLAAAAVAMEYVRQLLITNNKKTKSQN